MSLRRRRTLILILSLLALAAAATPASAFSPDTRKYGIVANTGGWGPGTGAEQDAALEMGATWSREEVVWQQVEPENDRWVWAKYDRLFTESSKRGLNVLVLLLGRPSWNGGSSLSFSSDPSEFAEFTAQVTARYGPGGSFWRANPQLPEHPATWFEIWNEPYFRFFSTDGVDPAKYARLVRASARAGRAANPRAKFLLQATTDAKLAETRWVNWTEALYDAVPDLNEHFDGIAPHPYSLKQSPDASMDRYWHDEFRRIERIRERFLAKGGNKPFWITEVGWSTCPSDSEHCVSEATQARWMKRMFAVIDDDYSSWVEAVFPYRLRDLGNPPDPSEKEHYFGLIRKDGSKKPAWHAFRAAATGGGARARTSRARRLPRLPRACRASRGRGKPAAVRLARSRQCARSCSRLRRKSRARLSSRQVRTLRKRCVRASRRIRSR